MRNDECGLRNEKDFGIHSEFRIPGEASVSDQSEI